MNAVVRIINSFRNTRKIQVTTGLAIVGFLTSVAIAVPLDKIQYNIVMTSDGYPIIWAENANKDYDTNGFEKKLTLAELHSLEYCSAGAGCSQEAMDKGAVYYLIQNIAGRGQVIAYYDANGKLIATQQLGAGAPTAQPTVTNSQSLLPTQSNNLKSADSIDDPVGYLEGEFAVSDSGAATYNVPLAIPPGTAGVQPKISLAYSSQSGEGIAGLGWSLSGLSAISRCPKNIAQDNEIEGVKFDSTDNFCLDGQRLVRVSGLQGANHSKYRTEIDNYSEITAFDDNGDKSPEYFEVKTKAGEIHVFGKTTDSRIKRVFSATANLPSTSDVVFSWAINRTKDRKDNYIDYVYSKNFGDITALEQHIVQIKYTGNLTTNLEPHQTINFEYNKVKKQQTSGYFAESNVKKTHLLSGIKIKHDTEQIREYKLNYYEPDYNLNDVSEHELYKVSKQDKIKSIQECGEDGDTCLPATYFKWDGAYKNAGSVINTAGKQTKSKNIYNPTPEDLLGKQLGKKKFLVTNNRAAQFKYHGSNDTKLFGDLNGDGYTDILRLDWNSLRRSPDSYNRIWRHAHVALNTAHDSNSVSFNTSSFDVSAVNSDRNDGNYVTKSRNAWKYPSQLADVDGDGFTDLISFNWKAVRVYFSDGTKFLPGRDLIQHFGQNAGGWRSGKHLRFVRDVNGDGKADIIGIDSTTVYISLSTGRGHFTAPKKWTQSVGGLDFSKEENSAEVIDVSGDGLPDLVVHSMYATQVFINNVSNESFNNLPRRKPSDYPDIYPYNVTGYTAALLSPLNWYNGRNYYSQGGRDHQRIMGDVNGDGYPDIVGLFAAWQWDVTAQVFVDKSGIYIAYGTGKGFKPYKLVPGNKSWGTLNSEREPSQLVDVNGDGKADLVNFGDNGVWVKLAIEGGFAPATMTEKWTEEFSWKKGRKWDSKDDIRTFGDFNADGLMDIIGIDNTGVYLGINQTKSLRITGITSGGILPDGSEENGVNRSIEIVYDRLTSGTSTYTKYSTASMGQINIQTPMYVVSAHYSSNGDISYNMLSGVNASEGLTAGLEYTYSGLRVDKKRGSVGFEQRTVRDLISNIITTREYYQDFPRIGQTKSEITELIEETSHKIISTKLSTFDKVIHTTSAALGSKKYYSVYAPTSRESSFKLTGQKYKEVLTTIPKPTSCGNFSSSKTKTTNTITGESYSKRTVNTYPTTSGDCFNRSRLISSKVISSKDGVASNAETRTSSFTYYSSGQIKTEVVEPNEPLSTTTTYVYDAYGNVTKKSIAGTGVTTRTVTTEYQHSGKYYSRFPTKITNAKGHTETRTYDYKQGLLASVTGPNGLTSKTYSNQFGQKYLTVAPNNTWVHTSYDWCNEKMTAENNESRYCTTTTTSEGGFSKTYYDQIDRVVRSETKGLNGEVIYNDKIYNLVNGQLSKESFPYYASETPKWVTYTYDKLERTDTVTQPDGSVSSVAYDGLTTTVTDANVNAKTETNDIQGKPKLVEDALGNTIAYEYYANGSLKSTTNTASSTGGQTAADKTVSVTSFTYNKLGNKKGMVDPDMGTWSYKYNAFGELTKQKDAEGQIVTMEYDKLGRLVKRTEPEGITEWTYDTATGKGKGKLHTVTSPSGYKKTVSYNNFGQLAIAEEQIPNSVNGASDGTATYYTQNTYDEHGRLDTVTYPKTNPLKPIVVQHIYNAQGNLTSIKNAITGNAYWTVNIADAKGNLTKQTLGNGVISSRTYDTLGRLDSIVSKKGSTALQDLAYNFDTVGNLVMRENHINHVKEDFGYDNIYRLANISTGTSSTASLSNTGGALYGFAMPVRIINTGGSHPAVKDKSFSYDGHGNIMTKQAKTYTYNDNPVKRTHAVTKISSKVGGKTIDKTFTYDANGNMLGSYEGNDSRTITWTSFNKPEEITKTKNNKDTSIRLAYDDGHNRILKQSSFSDNNTNKIAKNTWYIAGGLVEREETASGANKGAEVYKFSLKAGGQTVGYIQQFKSKLGRWTTEKTRYLLTDHLGSSDVVTNEAGGVVMRTSFDAWGKRRNSSWMDAIPTELDQINARIAEKSFKMGFTGHEHDDEVGLINMKGRMYDAEIGRFISADPFVQAATDTQSYSRYSYVRNNPLSLVDPSGYNWLSKLFKGITRFFKKHIRTIIAIAATIITGGLAAGYMLGGIGFGSLASLGLGQSIIAGAVGGFFGGLVSTGSLKGALRGAVFGGLSAGLANGIGHGFGGGGIGAAGSVTRAIAHGVAQGTVSVLRGGKFGAGFISSFASSVASPFIKGGNIFAKAAKHAVLGGTVAVIVGGKFANGAVTAAFTYLFNDAVEKTVKQKVASAKIKMALVYKTKILLQTLKGKNDARYEFALLISGVNGNNLEGIALTILEVDLDGKLSAIAMNAANGRLNSPSGIESSAVGLTGDILGKTSVGALASTYSNITTAVDWSSTLTTDTSGYYMNLNCSPSSCSPRVEAVK